jgi:hypothetical protein
MNAQVRRLVVLLPMLAVGVASFTPGVATRNELKTATAGVPQEANLRIYGIGFGAGSRRPEGSELIELPVTMSEDGRHARFRLMVSVRNYGPATARYKLHVQVAGRGSATGSPLFDVAKNAVRREAYDVDLDFALPSGIAVVLPGNPVRADLLLLDEDGRELGRKAFNLILRPFPRATPRRLRTDLRVEEARFVYRPGRNAGIFQIKPHVSAEARIRNVGTETWGFRGDVSLHLQIGTPETRLEDLGERGMPTAKSLPLPRGLTAGSDSTISTPLETRLRATSPIGGSRIIEITPPLRAGVWYTLTVSTSSEADLDPSNDSVRLIFMLNDDLTIRESRTVRVTNRVRVLTR